MKRSNQFLSKVLFGVIGLGSLIMSACSLSSLNNISASTTDSQTDNELPAVKSPTDATKNKNLAELAHSAANNGSFTTLTKAVEAAGLKENLAKGQPYTVFSPTDAAFEELPAGTIENLMKPENKAKLAKLLAYHVVPGKVTSSNLPSGKVKTIEGSPINIKVDSTNSTVTVNESRVIQPDIPARNGVVHVVDKVILPPDLHIKS